MKIFLLLLPLILMAGCQDHHFIPMDKADKVKLPKPPETAGRSFVEGDQAQKYIMGDDYQKEKSPADATIIATGGITVGTSVSGKDIKGYTLYLIAREDGKQGPPLAVKKYSTFKFPVSFSLTVKDMMLGSMPPAGTKIVLEARLDADGDVISKNPGDYYGKSQSFPLGGNGMKVVIDSSR